MKRQVQVKQCDLFEPSIELSEVLDQPVRAQVLELLCDLLLEICAHEQIDQTIAGAKNK